MCASAPPSTASGITVKKCKNKNGLALSVTYGDTSPKGRGLGKEMKLAWTAKGSPFEERLPPRRGKMSRSDKRGNLASSKAR